MWPGHRQHGRKGRLGKKISRAERFDRPHLKAEHLTNGDSGKKRTSSRKAEE
jgi:hypothetical protein